MSDSSPATGGHAPPYSWLTRRLLLIVIDSIIVVSGTCFIIFAGYPALYYSTPLPALLAPFEFAIYLAPILLFIFTAFDRIVRHARKVHIARLEDSSEVERLFHDSALREEQSNSLITSLRGVGSDGWIDYEILPLRQLIVENANPSRLVPMAKTILSELEEYADDPKYRYDQELYERWKKQIQAAIEGYERDLENINGVQSLRSVICAAYEHLVDYEMKWAQGSVMVASLFISVAVGTIVTAFCGLLPFIYFQRELGIMNWAVLGASGGLMAVLWTLWNSDETEVGNTEGRKEIARAVGGGALGVMGGFIVYGAAAAGLLPTTLAPKLDSHALPDIGKALIWAIFAGFFIELVVDNILGRFKGEMSNDTKPRGE